MANKLRSLQRSCRNKSFDAATSKRLRNPGGVWAQFIWLVSEREGSKTENLSRCIDSAYPSHQDWYARSQSGPNIDGF